MIPALLPVVFCFIVGSQKNPAEVHTRADQHYGIVAIENYKIGFDEYSQNQATEWQRLKNPSFPLSVNHWELVPNPSASDKSMDKMIVGRVKNNSKKEFSEVRIEFIVYDDEGNQIATVHDSFYDFKGQETRAFKLLVTHDVVRASFNGLSVPSKEGQ
jgi:hypothetical protein